MILIAGLGNPGREYQGTRHNVGFEVIERLAARHGIALSKRNHKAVYGEGVLSGERLLLARPMTYMNLSGEAALSLSHYYRIAPQQIWVVYDDIALPLGRLRLREKGSAGGHNGLQNIITLLHTQDIPRLRIGVGAARPGQMVNHVLSRFRKEEGEVIEQAYELAADALEAAIAEGFERAMNRYNVSEKEPKQPSEAAIQPASPEPAV